ncbi:MAG TPA: polysaccharide ABC transporter ATP-binding protein [Gemmatimonadaceae bacterium]|jgi:lipopolysaccharide transport system ATP-binding protein|nr:polysaccharide ABC transporter ATP-binding protein [Gemmatimonadaceae bacterium]
MSDVAISMDEVWKKFRRGERHDSLRDLVPAVARRIIRGAPPANQLEKGDFWALRDVSFEVKRGDALGIIGHNGAGKSTLLKILTKLLRPTMGSYVTHGRIGALIEVTAGFHTDLTGRENIYLNGSIIGMKRVDIEKRFDAIVEFSGIGEFIDTPVKRYSSGMNARLGFSIAAHLEPEILIVDEVLSVGDYTFQGKCIRWMQDLLQNGTTVIFVSHNMDAVLSLCNSALLLDHGKVLATGELTKVVAEYYSSGGRWKPELFAEPRVTTVEFTSSVGSDLVVAPGERVVFTHTFAATANSDLTPGFFVSRGGKIVLDTTYARMLGHSLPIRAGETASVDWSMAFNLPAGVYEIGYHVGEAGGGYHDYKSRSIIVTVADDPRVKGESYVDLRLEERRHDGRVLESVRADPGILR